MPIKLRNEDEVARMRVAGRLAASVLEMIGEHVATRHHHRGTRSHLPPLHRRRTRRDSGAAQLQQRAGPAAVSEVDLHVGQPRRVSRHPVGEQTAEARRRGEHRRHRHQGSLSRRHQQDVLRRRTERDGAASRRDHAGVSVSRHPGRASRRAPRRHRPRDSVARRSQQSVGGARILRPRHRRRVPRRAAGAALRPAEHRHRRSRPA